MGMHLACFVLLLTTRTDGTILEVDVAAMSYYSKKPNLATFEYTIAPMEMAVEDVNWHFRGSLHFNLILVYDRRHDSCPQFLDDSTGMVAKWYYTQRRPENVSLSVLVSPGTF